MRLGLPMDIAAGLPHLEVNGFRECSVDRHTGILEYNRERIVIGLNIGSLTVVGSGLEIRADAPGTADDHRADRLSDLR